MSYKAVMSYFLIVNKIINPNEIDEIIPIHEVRKNGIYSYQFSIILTSKKEICYSRSFRESNAILVRLEMEELYTNLNQAIKERQNI